jgi:hypothetical protein
MALPQVVWVPEGLGATPHPFLMRRYILVVPMRRAWYRNVRSESSATLAQ